MVKSHSSKRRRQQQQQQQQKQLYMLLFCGLLLNGSIWKPSDAFVIPNSIPMRNYGTTSQQSNEPDFSNSLRYNSCHNQPLRRKGRKNTHRQRSTNMMMMMLSPDQAMEVIQTSILPTMLPVLLSLRDSAMQVAQSVPEIPFVTQHIVQPFSNGLANYQTLLANHPITTKATTAAVLGCAGDAIAQYKSFMNGAKNENDAGATLSFDYDWKRGMAFLVFGAMYTGCFQHFWFTTLNKNILDWGEDLHVWGHPAPTNIALDWYISQKEEWWEFFDVVAQIDDVMAGLPDPPSAATLAAAKVALNQFLVIPTVYMPLFFAITGAVAGMDVEKSIARAQSLYIPLLRRNYLFWLPMQFLQFLVLPDEWQIPFLCVASLCWTVILSSIGGSTPPSSTNVAYETVASNVPAAEEEFAEIASVPIPINSMSGETVEIGWMQDDEKGEEEDSEEEIVRVIPNEAGPINDMTDGVRFEDVRKVLVPDQIVDVVSDPKVRSAVGGLALGVIAGAADDAAIGIAIGDAIGGLGATPGIALTSAAGAVAAYFAASQASVDSNDKPKQNEEELPESTMTTTFEMGKDLDVNTTHTTETGPYDALLDEREGAGPIDAANLSNTINYHNETSQLGTSDMLFPHQVHSNNTMVHDAEQDVNINYEERQDIEETAYETLKR